MTLVLQQPLPKASYYHFGDIDCGGFQIYFNLIEKTQIPFKRLFMDEDTLKAYFNYAKRLTENDVYEIDSMLKNTKCSEVHSIINVYERAKNKIGTRMHY